MLQALIFDVDGTLAETEEAHRQAFNEIFAAAGLGWHWTRADYLRLLRTTGGKERMRAFRQEIGATAPDDAEIARLHRVKTARYGEILTGGGLALRPGVRELVAAAGAAGLRLAVATTTNRPNVEVLCHACWGRPADEIFEVIAAGDEVAHKKPAPDVFRLALDRLGLRPQAALAIEDSRNGLRSAKGAGLATLVVPSAYTEAEDFTGADWIAPDLNPANLPPVVRDGIGAATPAAVG